MHRTIGLTGYVKQWIIGLLGYQTIGLMDERTRVKSSQVAFSWKVASAQSYNNGK